MDKELKRTSTIVLKILKEDEHAREDDFYLFEKVLEHFIPGISRYIRWIHNSMRLKKLPTWETMRRSRQKMQKDHPELKDVETMIHRAEKEEEVLEFVRS